jgi:hypothetical protein
MIESCGNGKKIFRFLTGSNTVDLLGSHRRPYITKLHSAFTDKDIKATVTCPFPVGNAQLTAKSHKIFSIRVKSLSTRIKSRYFCYDTTCRKPGSDSCVQLYQWTHCSSATRNKLNWRWSNAVMSRTIQRPFRSASFRSDPQHLHINDWRDIWQWPFKVTAYVSAHTPPPSAAIIINPYCNGGGWMTALLRVLSEASRSHKAPWYRFHETDGFMCGAMDTLVHQRLLLPHKNALMGSYAHGNDISLQPKRRAMYAQCSTLTARKSETGINSPNLQRGNSGLRSVTNPLFHWLRDLSSQTQDYEAKQIPPSHCGFRGTAWTLGI